MAPPAELQLLTGRHLPRFVGFNLLSALALGIGGFFFGAFIGDQIAAGKPYLIGTDQNDVAVFVGFLFGSLGWLAGLGFFNYPVLRMLGRPASVAHEGGAGVGGV